MLYRIHLATTRLVLESDNLKHWWMVTSSRTSSPMQMAQAVVPSYNASTVAQSTSTSDPSTVDEISAYSLQCGADQIIQQIITEKLKQVRMFKYFSRCPQFRADGMRPIQPICNCILRTNFIILAKNQRYFLPCKNGTLSDATFALL